MCGFIQQSGKYVGVEFKVPIVLILRQFITQVHIFDKTFKGVCSICRGHHKHPSKYNHSLTSDPALVAQDVGSGGGQSEHVPGE